MFRGLNPAYTSIRQGPMFGRSILTSRSLVVSLLTIQRPCVSFPGRLEPSSLFSEDFRREGLNAALTPLKPLSRDSIVRPLRISGKSQTLSAELVFPPLPLAYHSAPGRVIDPSILSPNHTSDNLGLVHHSHEGFSLHQEALSCDEAHGQT